MGRDPLTDPLSSLEMRLFERAIKEFLDMEFAAPDRPSSDDD